MGRAKKQEQHKLCYIEGNIAYFTTKPLNEQWGDDWDDTPYEHNAGEPYSDEEGQIREIAFYGDFQSRHEGVGINSPWSVQDINSGATFWLCHSYYSKKKASVKAGITIENFIDWIHKNEGKCGEMK